MRNLFYVLLIGFCVCSHHAFARKSTFYVNKIYDYPQSQLEEIIENYDRGGFCAPAAASNILKTFHSARNIDQGEMIKELASPEYMNTDPNMGTSIYNFMHGIHRYANENFRRKPYITYQGVGSHNHFHTGVLVPDVDWITDGIGMNKGAWLAVNLAKYNEEDDTYNIIGGHLLTLVGYNVSARSTIFIVNDSASAKTESAQNEYLKLEPIETGYFVSKGNKMPAKGFLKIIDGQKIQYAAEQDYDTIIVTRAVRLDLE